MSKVIVLIPPSEGKASSGTQKPLKALNNNAQVMYERLISYRGNWQELYGVKGKALEAAKNANAQLVLAPTLPAIERYSGVVYDGIDYPSLSFKAKDFFNKHVRIVSALFGLIEPQELIPDYKLKIEKLDAANFWRPIVAGELTKSFVIDLLPKAHQKAVEYRNGIKVDFIVSKKGKNVPAGHFGKLIKGQFIRWLVENEWTDPQEFARFDKDGFVFDGKNFIKNI